MYVSSSFKIFTIYPSASIEIDVGVDILKHLFNYSVPYILTTSNVDNFCKQVNSTEQPSIKNIEATNVVDVEHATKKIATYFEDHVFPVLKECHSIIGIDKHMNTLPFCNCPLNGGGGNNRFVIQLIVAHLAKNKNYATLVNDFLEAADQNQKYYLEKAIPYLNQLSQSA
jgi:hypothetical protein